MPTVELVYDPGCPNVAAARAHLLRAFAHARLAPSWSEYAISDPATPRHARGYGSPTLLVDGRDVSGEAPGEGACCRLYTADDGGPSRVPPVALIASALRGAISPPAPPRNLAFGSSLAALPGIGSALLPKLACPACWPAYAGLLSSAGLGFLVDAKWLLASTAAFLLVAMAALAFGARRRRGFGPLALGLLAAVAVLLGKFAFDSDVATYAGIGLLVLASLWNAWPRSLARGDARAPATP